MARSVRIEGAAIPGAGAGPGGRQSDRCASNQPLLAYLYRVV